MVAGRRVTSAFMSLSNSSSCFSTIRKKKKKKRKKDRKKKVKLGKNKVPIKAGFTVFVLFICIYNAH